MHRWRKSIPVSKLYEAARWWCRAIEIPVDSFSETGEEWLVTRAATLGVKGVVFDVGANIGEWSEMVLKLWPAAHIHAFEIVPKTAVSLKKRFGYDDQVTVNVFGLGPADSHIDIKYYPGRPKMAGFLIEYPQPEAYEIITGELRRGSDYVSENGIEEIALLKIDTEGAEHLVLQGLRELLEHQRIKIIQFEYGRANILTRFLLKDFYEMLEPMGYKLGKLFNDGVAFKSYELGDEDFTGPNYVAALDSIADALAVKS